MFRTLRSAFRSRSFRSLVENFGKFGNTELLYPRQPIGTFVPDSSAIAWASLKMSMKSRWVGNLPKTSSSEPGAEAVEDDDEVDVVEVVEVVEEVDVVEAFEDDEDVELLDPPWDEDVDVGGAAETIKKND